MKQDKKNGCAPFLEEKEKSKFIFYYLKQHKQTLSFAESCTGGGLSYLLSSQPGISRCFKGGLVSYALHAKSKIFNIPKDLLDKRGAVNEEVCFLMARGVISLFKVDWGVSVTGVMGPGRLLHDPSPGTVFAGIVGPRGYKKILKKVFPESVGREMMREKTMSWVLDLLYNSFKVLNEK